MAREAIYDAAVVDLMLPGQDGLTLIKHLRETKLTTPVIVLNPVHPEVLAELRKYGYPGRKRSLEYLHELHAQFDFVVVDAEDIRTWHGVATDFSNVNHVNLRNMRRLLRYVIAHSHGALG